MHSKVGSIDYVDVILPKYMGYFMMKCTHLYHTSGGNIILRDISCSFLVSDVFGLCRVQQSRPNFHYMIHSSMIPFCYKEFF